MKWIPVACIVGVDTVVIVERAGLGRCFANVFQAREFVGGFFAWHGKMSTESMRLWYCSWSLENGNWKLERSEGGDLRL